LPPSTCEEMNPGCTKASYSQLTQRFIYFLLQQEVTIKWPIKTLLNRKTHVKGRTNTLRTAKTNKAKQGFCRRASRTSFFRRVLKARGFELN
jgi:hypothetical protein